MTARDHDAAHGASIPCIDKSILMSQGPEIQQIKVNYTAQRVSRPTPKLTASTTYCLSRGALCEWW